MADSCGYRFPDDHPRVHESDETWDCPHERHDDSEHCLFHMPIDEKERRDIPVQQVREALEDRIQQRGRETKSFKGARFRKLDLSHFIFSSQDNYPVDLSHSRIHGGIDLAHADFVQPLILSDARIDGPVKATNARFGSYLWMDGLDAHGHVDMSETIFQSDIVARGATFTGAGSHEEYEEFVASFKDCTFQETAVFDDAAFEGRADLRGIEMTTGRFHGTVFDIALFGGSDIERIAVTAPRAQDEQAYLSFVSADLEGGVLKQPYYLADGTVHYPDEEVYYNLTEAAVGRVDLEPDKQGELFRYVHVSGTDFKGFDFASHEPYLRPDWDIHSYDGPLLPEGNVRGEPDQHDGMDPGQAELTYLKAKKGAKAIEHSTSASEFFRNQIRHRKQTHLETAKDSSHDIRHRAMAGLSYIGHHVNGILSGHFERPWRVLGSSILLTFLCALLYPAIGGIRVSGTGEVIRYSLSSGLAGLIDAFQQSLYFSSITITTLGYGDMFPVGTLARQLAGWEARLGSLLMALFIFVLGRRVS
jgi:uncharacterized protein YjbI with pentapeptide repeats